MRLKTILDILIQRIPLSQIMKAPFPLYFTERTPLALPES